MIAAIWALDASSTIMSRRSVLLHSPRRSRLRTDALPRRRLFERLLELEFDAAHFSIPWTDVTADEVRGLQVL
jgi:hypothetical protein